MSRTFLAILSASLTVLSLTATAQAQNLTSVRVGDNRLDLIEPSPFSYTDGSDYTIVNNSVSATASGPLTAVALALAPSERPNSTSGCDPSQFGSFPNGNIALIQRGGCSFAQKVSNAENAGASGVLLFDQGVLGTNLNALPTFNLGNDWAGSIPVLALSFNGGEFFAGFSDLAFSMETQLYRGPREQALLRYCEANRDECALSVSFHGSEGDYWERHLNGDRRQVTASTYKTLMLIAYAQGVLDSDLDPDDVLNRDEWGRFAIRFDGNAMTNVYQRLGQPATVTVDEIMSGMMRESDNAAPDWLLNELGTGTVNAVFNSYVDGFHDLPIPINAYLMLLNGRVSEPDSANRIVNAYPSGMDDPAWRDELFALFDGQMQDSMFMEDARDFLCAALPWESPPSPCTFGGQGSFESTQTFLGQHFTRTTSRTMLRLSEGLLDRTLLSPQLQAEFEPRFEWILENSDFAQRFSRYGFKGGSFGPNNICNSHGYAETVSGDRISYAFYIQNSLHRCGVGLFASSFHQSLAEDAAFRELLRNDIAFDSLFSDRFRAPDATRTTTVTKSPRGNLAKHPDGAGVLSSENTHPEGGQTGMGIK